MQSQPCIVATAVSHGKDSAVGPTLANTNEAASTGSLDLGVPAQQHASIAMLPDEMLLHIIDLLDLPSRRAFRDASGRTRDLLEPQRRFDRLLASIRWAGSCGRLAELLGAIADEAVPQRSVLLGSVIERIQRSAKIPPSLLGQLAGQLKTLPAAERARLLAALAAATGSMRADRELKERLLAIACELPPNLRGKVFGQCLMSLCPATSEAAFEGWIAMAGDLPQEGASRLLEAVVDVAARKGQLREEMVASVLERVRAMHASDGMPAPCQARVLKKLVEELDAVVEKGPGAKSNLVAWDAIFDTTLATLGSGHWPLTVIGALHAWLQGSGVSSMDRLPRTGRLSELNAGLKADELLVVAGSTASRTVKSAQLSQPLNGSHLRLAQAAGLDVATQARLYTEYANLFVPLLGPADDNLMERELFLRGLSQIQALKPMSMQVGPLTAWGAALAITEDAQAWRAFMGAVSALPVEDRPTVLRPTSSSCHAQIGFSSILPQVAVMPPALGGPLLGQLVWQLMGQSADEQVARLNALTTCGANWPPNACTDLVVNSLSFVVMLSDPAQHRLLRFAKDIVSRLWLAERARVLGELAVQRDPVCKGWVLEQLPALGVAQQQLAIPGEPMLHYRAEIVRRMLVAMRARDIPTEIQFGMLWPSLREALGGLEAEARGSAYAALRGILGRVPAALRPEVEHALATRWAADFPGQQQLPASPEML